MFTGIIEAAGKIESIEHGPDGGRLRVNLASAPAIADGMKLGDSISVNGCCLTVVEFAADHFSADLSGETLRRTSLGERKPGDPVNLERPLATGGRLGGHFVQGHVDGIGHVTRLVPEGAEGTSWWLSVSIPEDLRRYVAEKGSIAIDGISLTVARWRTNSAVAGLATQPDVAPADGKRTGVRRSLWSNMDEVRRSLGEGGRRRRLRRHPIHLRANKRPRNGSRQRRKSRSRHPREIRGKPSRVAHHSCAIRHRRTEIAPHHQQTSQKKAFSIYDSCGTLIDMRASVL